MRCPWVGICSPMGMGAKNSHASWEAANSIGQFVVQSPRSSGSQQKHHDWYKSQLSSQPMGDESWRHPGPPAAVSSAAWLRSCTAPHITHTTLWRATALPCSLRPNRGLTAQHAALLRCTQTFFKVHLCRSQNPKATGRFTLRAMCSAWPRRSDLYQSYKRCSPWLRTQNSSFKISDTRPCSPCEHCSGGCHTHALDGTRNRPKRIKAQYFRQFLCLSDSGDTQGFLPPQLCSWLHRAPESSSFCSSLGYKPMVLHVTHTAMGFKLLKMCKAWLLCMFLFVTHAVVMPFKSVD